MPPQQGNRAAQVVQQAREQAAQGRQAQNPTQNQPEGQNGPQEGQNGPQEGDGGSFFEIMAKQLLQDMATSIVTMFRLSSQEARRLLDEVQV